MSISNPIQSFSSWAAQDWFMDPVEQRWERVEARWSCNFIIILPYYFSSLPHLLSSICLLQEEEGHNVPDAIVIWAWCPLWLFLWDSWMPPNDTNAVGSEAQGQRGFGESPVQLVQHLCLEWGSPCSHLCSCLWSFNRNKDTPPLKLCYKSIISGLMLTVNLEGGCSQIYR